jgi:hypothetical protein
MTKKGTDTWNKKMTSFYANTTTYKVPRVNFFLNLSFRTQLIVDNQP